jgi:NRAMP (natural resistance-associated macrophage protein)-like metal ion transporter
MPDDIPSPPRELSPRKPRSGVFRVLGSGIVTGAADDDPSAIGTYAAAGAKFGFGFLWIAPVLLPMMYLVVYLSAKLGRVYGKGLFAIIRDRYPAWVLFPTMLFAFTGNIIEAAANLGGIGAAMNLLVPVPIPVIVAVVAAVIFALQLIGSYDLLRNIFKWLALSLLAYIGAAVLARPDAAATLRGTLIPHVRMDREFMSMVVACIGTSLSAYIFTWQSNQEVEEQRAEGLHHAWQRRGASRRELERTRRDVIVGMLFSNVILYFILLSTAATLHASGQTEVRDAAQVAAALEPLAGPAAKYLFALGVLGVGCLAVPVMTIGAAYDLAQGFGRTSTLHAKPAEAPFFYGTIALVTLLAVLLNMLGFNPMKALVWSGIVQGISVPPLLLLMMLMTNDRKVMGKRTNGIVTNTLGWITVTVTALAALCLGVMLLLPSR